MDHSARLSELEPYSRSPVVPRGTGNGAGRDFDTRASPAFQHPFAIVSLSDFSWLDAECSSPVRPFDALPAEQNDPTTTADRGLLAAALARLDNHSRNIVVAMNLLEITPSLDSLAVLYQAAPEQLRIIGDAALVLLQRWMKATVQERRTKPGIASSNA